jgi:hypothetical protein
MASAAPPPHAREDPPWTWCGDRRAPHFGSVFAHSGACGSTVLSFDPAGRHHALTLLGGARRGAEIVIYGRRFDVVPGAMAEERR